MAETAIPIFADLTNRKLVSSSKGGQFIFQSPFHQDKLYLAIQPLSVNPGGGQSLPYTVLDGESYTIAVIVVTAAGVTLAGPITAFVTDGGTAMLGSVELNTVAMATAIAAANPVNALIQFQFDDGPNVKTTIEQSLTIKKTYITAGTPSELPVASYLTREESIALFLKKSGNAPGAALTLRDSTDTYELIVQCNTDGSNASNSGS